MKAMDYKKEDQYYNINHDDDEKYADKNKKKNKDVLYNYINQQLYPYNSIRLTNDYFHLITQHKHEFNTAYDKITNEIGTECDINFCSSFERIEKDAISSRDGNDNNNNNDDSKSNRISHKESDIFHICDQIHCYFLHSYDIGMKLSDSQLQLIQNKMSENRNDDDDDDDDDDSDSKSAPQTDSDAQFRIMKQELIKKKKKLQKHLTFLQIHYGDNVCNKFVTTSCGIDNNNNNNNNHIFGYKYFYWSYYKDNEEQDLKYNVGFKINNFYIEPRYKDIKTEIIHNNIHCIDQKKWDYFIRRALALLRCDIVKKMKCNNMVIDDHFDSNIEPGNAITVSHVLSILIYTNAILLQRALTSTYTKLTENESLIALKKRHSKMANFAKYLFETVHCFGDELSLKQKQFYHGIDSIIYFTNCNINFNHPISSSGSIVVTTSYSISSNINNKNNNDGILLRLIKSDCLNEENKMFKLHYFNCSIFSDFSFEDEYLFNGSWNGLQIDSIYHISINRKYKAHLNALRILDLMLKGYWMKTSLPPTSRKIISMLFTNELKHWLGIQDPNIILQENIYKLPEYVELSYHAFNHSIKSLVFDIASFMKSKHKFNDEQYFGYLWLRRFIIYQQFYFINLDVIIPLFPSCQTLTILNSVSMASSTLKFELNEEIFKQLLKVFKKFKHSTELKQIQISGFQTSKSKVQRLVQNYYKEFIRHRWHAQTLEAQNQVLLVIQNIQNNKQ